MHWGNTPAFLVLGGTFAVFGLFMGRFRRPKGSRAVQSLIVVTWAVSLGQLAAVALADTVSAGFLAAGSALCAAGVALYAWALWTHGRSRPGFALGEKAPITLQESGPYALVRHPIYTAYLLAWCAGPLLATNPWLLIATACMAIVFHRAAAGEERAFASTPFADAYRTYARRTGMFLPRLWP